MAGWHDDQSPNRSIPLALHSAGLSEAEWNEVERSVAGWRSVLGKGLAPSPVSQALPFGKRIIPFSASEMTEDSCCRHGSALGADQRSGVLRFEGRPFCRRTDVRLRGEHNISNLLAAAAVSGAAGASQEAMGRVARSFAGVPHRLEEMRPKGNVVWINDSIATAPERAVAGLQVFPPGAQTLILLAGGKDKNLPWDTFADEVLDRVQCLIGFGEAGSMIADKVRERASFRRISAPCCAVVQRLDEAVVLARQTATPGTVVLFAPGGTSYDAYKNFEQRGEHFRNLVAGG